jgi:aminopeptidase N
MVGRIGTGKPGESRVVRTLLTRARETIPAQGADLTFIYGNAGEGGFYRPHHGDGLQRDLIEELAGLEPIERQGLVDHEWALVRSGHNTLAGLLDLAAKLGADHDPDVLAAVHQPLHSLCKRLAPDMTPASEERLRAWVEVYFGGQVDELGWDPAEGESADTRLRRAEILSIVGLVGEASSVVEEAARRCEAYLEDRGSLDPDLTDVVVSIAAAHGGKDLYDAIEHTMRGRCTPQEERRLLIALADFREPELIQRSLELTTGGDVPLQDVVFLLTRLFANRHACVQTWEFIQERWSTLREHLATQLGSRLIAATPALLTPRYKREVASFFREHPLPATERALRQALERFDWYAEFRLRVGPQLEKYLLG